METSLKSTEWDSVSARLCNLWDSTSTIECYPFKLRTYLCFKWGMGIMYISDDCCHKRLVYSFRMDKCFSAGIQVCVMGTFMRITCIKIIQHILGWCLKQSILAIILCSFISFLLTLGRHSTHVLRFNNTVLLPWGSVVIF